MNALTSRPEDLPEGEDERLKNMEQEDLERQTLPVQLRLLADGLPMQDRSSIPDLFTQPYETDPLPGQILEAIRANGSLKEITVAEFME